MATWMIDEPRKLTFDTVRRLRVKAVAGSIAVVGTDERPTLEVSELDGPPLRARHEDGELVVGYERPLRWGPLGLLLGWRQRYRAVISLAVPRDCEVDVQAVSSALMVSGLRAPLAARTISGEITLSGCSGQVKAQTVSGAVQAHGVAGDLWAHTVSGDLTLVEGGGTVGARTISGTVTLDVRAPGAGDIRVTTTSGDVTIRLPHASDLQVQVDSTSGQVASAFHELHRDGRPALHSIWGRLGAGTGRLRATTTSGHVTLLRREPEAEAEGSR
jgi:Putative adhesin